MVTEQMSSFVSARFLVLFRAAVVVGGVNKLADEDFNFALEEIIVCGSFGSVIVDAVCKQIDFSENFLP